MFFSFSLQPEYLIMSLFHLNLFQLIHSPSTPLFCFQGELVLLYIKKLVIYGEERDELYSYLKEIVHKLIKVLKVPDENCASFELSKNLTLIRIIPCAWASFPMVTFGGLYILM